jgi:hypothetical protein
MTIIKVFDGFFRMLEPVEKGNVMNPTNHFCTCKDISCRLHPSNHQQGCDPCIQKNLGADEIPSCFFNSVDPDVSNLKGFNTGDFVKHYLKHRDDKK